MFNCLNCNEEVKENYPSEIRKYCSKKCQQSFQFNVKYQKWLDGELLNIDPRAEKRCIIKRDGYSCSKCNISEWQNDSLTLELEHKNGNSSDSSPDNLCLLCPNCHSQTSTYKGRNKGNGRHSRRERYKAGKSY